MVRTHFWPWVKTPVTPSEHPNPTTKIPVLKWVMNSPNYPKMGSPNGLEVTMTISGQVSPFQLPAQPLSEGPPHAPAMPPGVEASARTRPAPQAPAPKRFFLFSEKPQVAVGHKQRGEF